MSEQVMVLDKEIRQPSSLQAHESTWLGRWTQFHDQNTELIRSKDNARKSDREVSPFPMFKVSHKRDTTSTKLNHAYPDQVGSSSKAMANQIPWVNAQGDNTNNRLDFPIQEKTTQNLLELIRPVRIYATREINFPEEDGLEVLKGSTVSMKLKGKMFGGYLDLFPSHKGGATLQSLESSQDGPRKNESSAETNTLEMDRLETTIHLSASISSSPPKGKGRQSSSAIPRIEIPDMNEEPPVVPDRDGDEGETSNSATQSMNVEHFLPRDCKHVRLEPESEPSSRWVKRLKTTASDSSRDDETKSLMKTESRKGNNNNNLFLEILKCGINNPQPRNQEPTTSSQIKNEDITLLHPWIQRWCKKKDQAGGQEVSFEPDKEKEMEKKHFPSIAAMALMGKALSGLNPYGLRKTDSLMVWNARDIR